MNLTAESPLVSVIIPACNAANHLTQTLESALAQTWSHLEVIVVDDGSTDGTAAIVQAASARDPRVRLVSQPNAGVGAARNTGIRLARGKYIAPLDADDLWAPRKIELQVGRMESAGTNAGLAYCWLRNIDQQGRLLAWGQPTTIEGSCGSSMMLANFVGNGSSPLFRASALAATGLYLTRAEQNGAQGCEDWDLHLRIAERFNVCCVPAYLVGYRQGATNMSLNAASMAVSYEIAIRRVRERNPALPRRLRFWSAARFYSYLARRCYTWSDYPGALRYLLKVFWVDAASWLHGPFYRLTAGALLHLSTGGRLRRHREPPPLSNCHTPDFHECPAPVAGPRTLFTHIQDRRMNVALKLRSPNKNCVRIDRAFGY